MRTDEIVVGGRYVFWTGHVEAVGRVLELDAEDASQPPLVLVREEVTSRLFVRRGGHLLARLGEPIWNIRWPDSKAARPRLSGPLAGSERAACPLIRERA